MAKTLRTGWVIVQMLCRVEEYETVVAPRCQEEELSESSTLRKLFGLPVSERGVRQTNSRKMGGRKVAKATKATPKSTRPKSGGKTVESAEISDPLVGDLSPKASATTSTDTPEKPASAATKWEVTNEPWSRYETSVKLPPGALPKSMFDPNIDYEGGADDDEEETEAVTRTPPPDADSILDL